MKNLIINDITVNTAITVKTFITKSSFSVLMAPPTFRLSGRARGANYEVKRAFARSA